MKKVVVCLQKLFILGLALSLCASPARAEESSGGNSSGGNSAETLPPPQVEPDPPAAGGGNAGGNNTTPALTPAQRDAFNRGYQRGSEIGRNAGFGSVGSAIAGFGYGLYSLSQTPGAGSGSGANPTPAPDTSGPSSPPSGGPSGNGDLPTPTPAQVAAYVQQYGDLFGGKTFDQLTPAERELATSMLAELMASQAGAFNAENQAAQSQPPPAGQGNPGVVAANNPPANPPTNPGTGTGGGGSPGSGSTQALIDQAKKNPTGTTNFFADVIRQNQASPSNSGIASLSQNGGDVPGSAAKNMDVTAYARSLTAFFAGMAGGLNPGTGTPGTRSVSETASHWGQALTRATPGADTAAANSLRAFAQDSQRQAGTPTPVDSVAVSGADGQTITRREVAVAERVGIMGDAERVPTYLLASPPRGETRM